MDVKFERAFLKAVKKHAGIRKPYSFFYSGHPETHPGHPDSTAHSPAGRAPHYIVAPSLLGKESDYAYDHLVGPL